MGAAGPVLGARKHAIVGVHTHIYKQINIHIHTHNVDKYTHTYINIHIYTHTQTHRTHTSHIRTHSIVCGNSMYVSLKGLALCGGCWGWDRDGVEVG